MSEIFYSVIVFYVKSFLSILLLSSPATVVKRDSIVSHYTESSTALVLAKEDTIPQWKLLTLHF